MNFKYQFVAHCKIDVPNLALVKESATEGSMVDFCTVEFAAVESTIDKGHCKETALCKVALLKNAALKLIEIDLVGAITDFMVSLFKGISSFSHIFHEWQR